MKALFGGLILLVAAVVAAGGFLGWFKVSTDRTSTGEVSVRMGVDTPKVRQDMDRAGEAVRDAATAAKEKAAEVGEKAKEATEKVVAQARDLAADSVSGSVVSVDAVARKLTLKDDKDAVVVAELAADATVQANGQPKALADLKAGDRVRLVFRTKDGVRTGSAVTVGP